VGWPGVRIARRASAAQPRTRDAVLLGWGLGMPPLTRPYESVFLLAGVALFFAPVLWRRGECAGF